MKFNHINIQADFKTLTQARDYYCQLFDLVDGFRPEYYLRGYWLYRSADGLSSEGFSLENKRAVIHLLETDPILETDPNLSDGTTRESESQQFNLGINHIAFEMDDIVSFKRKLADMNIEYTEHTNETTQVTQLFFVDPAGVHLEVMFYLL